MGFKTTTSLGKSVQIASIGVCIGGSCGYQLVMLVTIYLIHYRDTGVQNFPARYPPLLSQFAINSDNIGTYRVIMVHCVHASVQLCMGGTVCLLKWSAVCCCFLSTE